MPSAWQWSCHYMSKRFRSVATGNRTSTSQVSGARPTKPHWIITRVVINTNNQDGIIYLLSWNKNTMQMFDTSETHEICTVEKITVKYIHEKYTRVIYPIFNNLNLTSNNNTSITQTTWSITQVHITCDSESPSQHSEHALLLTWHHDRLYRFSPVFSLYTLVQQFPVQNRPSVCAPSVSGIPSFSSRSLWVLSGVCAESLSPTLLKI